MSSETIQSLRNERDRLADKLARLERSMVKQKQHMEHLQYIIKKMPGYVYWKNDQLAYQGCNENLATFSRLKHPSDIVGMTDYDFEWGKDQAAQFRQDDRMVMKTGAALVTEYQLPQKKEDGHYLYVKTEKMPLYNQQKCIIGVLAIAIDITQQKQAERDRLLFQKKMKAAETKTTFISIMLHNLATPLLTLKLSIHLIDILCDKISKRAIDGQSFAMLHEEMEKLTKNSADGHIALAKISQFISDAKKHGSIEAVFGDSERQHLQIIDCLNDYLNQYRKTLNHDDLQRLHWRGRADFVFLFNKNIFHQLLDNLFNNAYEAIQSVSRGDVFVWTETGESFNTLHIKDTAKGISAERMSYIFDLYKTYDKPGQGTGLGLYFCKHAMESFGGQLKCLSASVAANPYTKFILSFPVPNLI